MKPWPAARHVVWLAAGGLWLAHCHAVFFGLVHSARDIHAHDFPDNFYLIERLRVGELPLWQPHIRLGIPFIAQLFTQVFYLPRVVTSLVWGHVYAPTVMHVGHTAFGFVGLWLAARAFGLRRAPAFVAAAPFFLSPFFVELSANESWASTAACAGWAVLAARRLRQRRNASSHAALAAVLGAAFLAGAPDQWFWLAFLVTAVSQRWSAVFSIVLAGAAAAVVILPAAELLRESVLPGAHPPGQFTWSVSWEQFVSLALPNADLPRSTDWRSDDQSFIWSLTIGSASFICALLGWSRRGAAAFLACAALFGALAAGRHFPPAAWLLDLPPLAGFRYPVKHVIGLLFSLSMLGGFGAQRLVALARTKMGIPPEWVWGLLATYASVLLTAALRPSRAGLVFGAAWALGFMGVLVLLARWRPRAVGWSLFALTVVELATVPSLGTPMVRAERVAAPSPFSSAVGTDPTHRSSVMVDFDNTLEWCQARTRDAGAMLESTGQRMSMLRFVESGVRSVTGYGFRDPWRLDHAFARGPTPFALAGVTTFVRNTHQGAPVEGLTPERVPEFDDIWVWRSPPGFAFPRSWWVPSAVRATDDEALEALGGSAQRFAEVVFTPDLTKQGRWCVSHVTVEEPRPESIVEHVEACDDGFVVLADAWYPGWEVEVDGLPAEPFRANFFLKGVAVAKGEHQIRWSYRPLSFRLGAVISLLTWLSLGVVGVAARSIRRARRASSSAGGGRASRR